MGLFKNVSNALFGGSKTYNPYTAPNVDFLREAAPTIDYRSILDSTPKTADNAFQDYLKSIEAPSSVDDVWGQVRNKRLESTIGDIERDTKQKFGTEMMGYFDRGLYDPASGADSDIARVGLAQVATGGARVASDARLAAYEDELTRLTGKEQAVQGAYGQRYGAAEAGDLSREGTAVSVALNNANLTMEQRQQLANALLGISRDSAASSSRTQNPGLISGITDNIGLNFTKKV